MELLDFNRFSEKSARKSKLIIIKFITLSESFSDFRQESSRELQRVQ